MASKKRKPVKLALVHQLSDYRPELKIKRQEPDECVVHKDSCRQFDLVELELAQAMYASIDGRLSKELISDIVSVQPLSDHDLVLVEAPCCGDGYALTAKQVDLLIVALQAAKRSMKP